MSETRAFTLVSELLEELTAFNRLEARGTLRLALKDNGLSAQSVTSAQMAALVEHVIESELASRGVENAKDIVRQLLGPLSRIRDDEPSDTPESSLRRLWGD